MNVPANANVEGAASLGTLYRVYSPRVYRMARHLLGNATDAEDVVQDVFLQVQQKLSTFRGESALSTWLYRLAVNLALAYRRKRSVRNRDQIQKEDMDAYLGNSTPYLLAQENADPQQQSLEHERQRLVDEAIAHLPEEQRDAVVLADLEELPLSEVAELLALSVPAVKSRLHRARVQLRALLARQFDEVEASKPSASVPADLPTPSVERHQRDKTMD